MEANELEVEKLARLARILAEPNRIRLLIQLAPSRGWPGARVSELREALGVAQSTASFHLEILRRARLVKRETIATSHYYRLRPNGARLLKKLAKLLPVSRGHL